MPDTGIGLIGSGDMGRAVARRVVEAGDSATVTAVYDPDPEAVIAARRDFGDEFMATRSVAELLERDDVDWVMIASWNRFHAEQTVAAFEAGKHVFCQKPLALTLEECLSMRTAWKASGREFVIGFNLRYSPHYRKIRSLITSGAIGDIISMEFNETLDFNHGGFIMGDWRRLRQNAGTHLLEKCCHDIDLANWMTGSRAARVASFGGLDFFLPRNRQALERVGKTRSGRQGYMTWRDGRTLDPFTSDKDILDNQVIILEYENGIRASMHLNSNTSIPERRMYICGTTGTLRADLHTGMIETRQIGFGRNTDRFQMVDAGMHGGGDEVLAKELVAVMTGEGSASTTLDDGLAAAVTCYAIDEATDSGEVISLDACWQKVDASI